MRKTVLTATALLLALGTLSVAGASDLLKTSAMSECAGTLCARRDSVNSVIARLRVTLHDKVKNKDYELSGAYLGDAAGNLRLRVTTEAGQLVLDMGMRGENVEICIPGKEQYLSGSREELLDHPQCNLTLLAHCGRARDLFFPAVPPSEHPGRGTCRVNGLAYFNIAETKTLLPRYTTRLSVNLAKSVVEEKGVYSRAGAGAGRVNYSQYRFPEAGAEQPKPAYPGRVTLRVPGGIYVLDMDVEDISLNTPIAPAKFAIPVPEGFKRETLAAALEKNINIWDQ